jgi:hydroxymethylglutaryl-CoA reductase
LVRNEEHFRKLKKLFNLTDDEATSLLPFGGLNVEDADKISENVIGTILRPLSILSNLKVNGKEYSIPVVTEQSSIISMIRRGIEFSNHSNGFLAENTGSTMIGQIQVLEVPDIDKGMEQILLHKQKILEDANKLSSRRKATNLKTRILETSIGPMLIVELYVDAMDSMGANIVNEMAETVSPLVEKYSQGRVNLRVLSNLATERLVRVKVSINKNVLGRNIVADSIVASSHFADADPYRATTHNKGIMNGVTSVLLALSNDIRAVEAGAHAYAARTGQYRPLSMWRHDSEAIIGELVLPMAVGVIGGAISSHPTAKAALKILGVEKASELGEVAASVGLACNLGALHILVTDGITSLSP